jgi:hypothetical protein
MRELGLDDPMPFGKHKDTPMREMLEDDDKRGFLDWLWKEMNSTDEKTEKNRDRDIYKFIEQHCCEDEAPF